MCGVEEPCRDSSHFLSGQADASSPLMHFCAEATSFAETPQLTRPYTDPSWHRIGQREGMKSTGSEGSEGRQRLPSQSPSE